MRICAITGCNTLNDNTVTHCSGCHRPLRNTIDILDPGMVLEGYEIQQYIGHGGFGVVYEGVRLRDGARVALKETFDAAHIRHFKREFDHLRHLHYENLPAYYDMFTAQDNGYLVMEFVEGESLLTLLERQGKPLQVTQVEGFAVQLCAAVRYLHERQPPLLHRDIKPANIRLRPDGVLKLVDFGIAKPQRTATQTYTRASQRAFSAVYAPPEQTTLQGKVTVQSDLYSIGATLYHLLTGHYPVPALDRMVASTDPLPAPHTLNPAISRTLSAVLLRAMALRPEDRYESVEALEYALRVAGHAPSRTFKSPKLLAGVFAGVILLGIGGVTLAQWYSAREPGAATVIAVATRTATSSPLPRSPTVSATIPVSFTPPTEVAVATVPSPVFTRSPSSTLFSTSTPVQSTPTPQPTPRFTATSGALSVPTIPRATATPRLVASATPRPVASATPLPSVRSSTLLRSPANGETFPQGSSIALQWQAQPLGAGEQYYVRLWKQTIPNVAEVEWTTPDTNVVVPPLSLDTYQWRVQVVGPGGFIEATRSEVRTFTITGQSSEAPPAQPQPTSAPEPTEPPVPSTAIPEPTEPPLPTREPPTPQPQPTDPPPPL